MESNKQEAHPTDKRMLMPSPRKRDDMNNGRMIFWDLCLARNCRTVEVVSH